MPGSGSTGAAGAHDGFIAALGDDLLLNCLNFVAGDDLAHLLQVSRTLRTCLDAHCAWLWQRAAVNEFASLGLTRNTVLSAIDDAGGGISVCPGAEAGAEAGVGAGAARLLVRSPPTTPDVGNVRAFRRDGRNHAAHPSHATRGNVVVQRTPAKNMLKFWNVSWTSLDVLANQWLMCGCTNGFSNNTNGETK